jgi:phenylpropionate dioxygenase-like ring-hydroxylating dioxygenase large terminal subunit
MKSAHGLKIPEPDYELTTVGPGTPGGEMLRRYWMPVCLADELKDLPKRVRVLGEDLVAFRDGQGRAGLLYFRCSHRGTSLEYGSIEERGIRCCYHGWLYDIEGNVLDMPLEPTNNPFLKQVLHPCYPVREFGGLVFAYMGPPDKIPEFPIYDVWTQPGNTLKARMGPRVGGAVDCNWIQSQENIVDALHVLWLHSRQSGQQLGTELYSHWPKNLEYEETELGMKFTMTYELPDGRQWDNTWEMLMPFTVFMSYTGVPVTRKSRNVAFCVPVDDTHQIGAGIRSVSAGEQEGKSHADFGPAARKDHSYEYTQRYPDDKEAQEGQGPIAIHALEHLVSSDRGVMIFRKILREAIRAVKEGRDPKGVIRDPGKARCVQTVAGSNVR